MLPRKMVMGKTPLLATVVNGALAPATEAADGGASGEAVAT